MITAASAIDTTIFAAFAVPAQYQHRVLFWGIVGAILAVPLLVIVKIIFDNIDATKPIATLISNR